MTLKSIFYESEPGKLSNEFYQEFFKQYNLKGVFHSERLGIGFLNVEVESSDESERLKRFTENQIEIKVTQFGDWEQ